MENAIASIVFVFEIVLLCCSIIVQHIFLVHLLTLYCNNDFCNVFVVSKKAINILIPKKIIQNKIDERSSRVGVGVQTKNNVGLISLLAQVAAHYCIV